MIGYETYKMLHLFFIITFFASLGFVASSSPYIQSKLGKTIIGFTSFLVLVAGMGLIARLGFKHGVAFPLWINLKIVNWLLINILLVLMFKFKNLTHKALLFLFILLIGWTSVWVVLNKPV